MRIVFYAATAIAALIAQDASAVNLSDNSGLTTYFSQIGEAYDHLDLAQQDAKPEAPKAPAGDAPKAPEEKKAAGPPAPEKKPEAPPAPEKKPAGPPEEKKAAGPPAPEKKPEGPPAPEKKPAGPPSPE